MGKITPTVLFEGFESLFIRPTEKVPLGTEEYPVGPFLCKQQLCRRYKNHKS